MKLTTNTLKALDTLRGINAELKAVNKERSTKRDVLIENIIADGVALYVANKDAFPTYNGFIKAYNAELLSNIGENEKSLLTVVEMVTFALKKGLSTSVKYGVIGKIFKYADFIETKTIKNATDKKAVNKEINRAKKAHNDALLNKYDALVKTLDNKSIEDIAEIREVLSIVNAMRKAKK